MHTKACLGSRDHLGCESRSHGTRTPASFALAELPTMQVVVSVKHFLRVLPKGPSSSTTHRRSAPPVLRLAVCQCYPFQNTVNEHMEVDTGNAFLVNNGELHTIALSDIVAPLVCARYPGAGLDTLGGDLLRLTRYSNCSRI
jgi:hypothetical protein